MTNDSSVKDADEVERMDEEFSGGYMYAGDGDWSFIKGVVREDEEITILANDVNFSTVPHDLRAKAYDMFEDSGAVIVHEETIDLTDSLRGETGQ